MPAAATATAAAAVSAATSARVLKVVDVARFGDDDVRLVSP